MKILAIDTSCDETSVAITDGRKMLANKIYSQVLIHKKWGGVVPSLAKRAHEEHIEIVYSEALKAAKMSIENIDAIAVTYGPGLAVALQVGINFAIELSKKYKKPLIPVNHMEGHIYSCFAQNQKGNPMREMSFPYLALLVSGAHTEIILIKNYLDFEILGSTLDDAAGEALDKASKMLGLGYPGGAVLERLAEEGDANYHLFPRPMQQDKRLDFSFSGLKTSLFYFLKTLSEEEKAKQLKNIAASYQEAILESLLIKLEEAMKRTGVSHILLGGGVSANRELRKRVKRVAEKYNGAVFFPTYKSLYGDNAAMIGIAAFYKAERKMFVKDFDTFTRVPRLKLTKNLF